MAGTAVASMGRLVFQIATTLQQMGNNWYVASNNWKEFPQKVESLDRKCKFWEAQFSRSGMSSDVALMGTLSAAKSLLEAEKAKLEKGQNSCSSRCFSKLSMTVFPAKVGLSIQIVIDAFDAIPDFLKLEQESYVTLQNRLLHTPTSLAIRADAHNRYVNLEVTEREVHSALSNPEGPNVVLLHGGAGRGKSTLARHVALHYKENACFDHVVILECGPELEKPSKQLELLNSFGWDSTFLSDQGQLDSHSSIPKLLGGALKCQKILIVFDDLWDGDFLQEVVHLCGNGVKCLVTSQSGNLCKRLNFSCRAIKIQVAREDSKKILASHVGFSDQLIPAPLEEIVDDIIRETEGLPLALALIATGIDSTRCNELEHWESASRNLSELLHSERTNHVDGNNYSKSFFSAMKISTQPLGDDARKLLVLMHLCDGSSVPEQVVRVLYTYGHFQGGHTPFDQLRMELESRELLKISSASFDSRNSPRRRAWSIHSLQNKFIQNEMRDEKNSMLTALSGLLYEVDSLSREWSTIKVPTDEETLIVLCALYLRSYFAEKVASRMEIPIQRFDELRKSVIEPISRLLGQPKSGRWTQAAESAARQVLMTYICNGGLHDNAVSHLLGLSVSTQIPMLNALRDIAGVEKTSLLNESTQFLVQALLGLFTRRDTQSRVNNAAAKAIMVLSRKDRVFLNSSGALDEALGLILSSEFHPGLQPAPAQQRSTESVEVAETHIRFTDIFNIPDSVLDSPSNSTFLQLLGVGVLAWLSEDCELKVITYPGALNQLVEFLSTDHPGLQVLAARTLGNLAITDLTQSKIANYPNALDRMTLLLSKDNDPRLQQFVALAFFKLAAGDNDHTKLKIVNCPGALDQLVRCLSIESHPDLQHLAASGLAFLAATDLATSKIANCPNALGHLTALLSKDNYPELQRYAASAVCTLSRAKDTQTILEIVNCPGALDKLVRCLSKESHPNLQRIAACALRVLAATDLATSKIANCPNALGQLTASLSNDQNPKLQLHAAGAFYNFSTVKDTETILEIVNCPGTLDQLVRCLSKEGHPDLQQVATCTLGILAEIDLATSKIANCPNALGQLTALLSKDNYPKLQRSAAIAFGELCKAKDTETILKIVNCPGALNQLVRCLSKESHPDLQHQAACALVNLAATELATLKIANCPNALGHLTASLSKDNDPKLQRYAATILGKLCTAKDTETILEIVNCPGALDQLVRCLSKESHPDIQRLATGALAILAATNRATSKIANCPNALGQLTVLLSKDNYPEPQLDAADAFCNLSRAKDTETILEIVNCPGALDELVRVLSKESHPHLQRRAACALGNLAATNLATSKIANCPNALRQLTTLLSKDNYPKPQLYAAVAFCNLTKAKDAETILEIVNCPGALEELVRCSSKESHRHLQRLAACALANLAATHLATLKITNCPNALGQPTALLSNDNYPALQLHAAGALCNLSMTGDTETILEIVNCPGTLDQLVRCLSKESHPDLQRLAAIALVNLATTNLATSKITNCPNALGQLTASLSNDNYPALQLHAAGAFCNLSRAKDPETILEIVNCPGTLDQLFRCLSKESHPYLQRQVASALRVLAATHQATSKIVNCPNALGQLTASLSNDNNPELQLHAAGAFYNLIRAKDTQTILEIVNCPGTLDQLVRCLSKESHPDLQRLAACALGNLAATNLATLKITNNPNALGQLTASLSNDNYPALQLHAAGAFCNLSRAKDPETILEIVNCTGTLDQLVRCLSKESHPDLQRLAACALGNVAATNLATLMIKNCPNALGQLTASLSRDDYPALQLHAANAFLSLSMTEDTETILEIANCLGTLDQLVQCLSKESHRDLQHLAAYALGNLAATNLATSKIANFPKALVQLTVLLSKDDYPEPQLGAAHAFCNLSRAEDTETILEIVNCPGALDELVGCLSKESHPGLQRQAAYALGNLVATNLETSKIANFPKALEQLTALLSKDDYPEPQLCAADAFCNLSRAKDTQTILEIVNCPGTLGQLVQCLSKKSHPDLQNRAACVLGNLAARDLATSKIANCPKALEQLTALLSKDDYPELQRHTARVFCNLSRAKDTETILEIVNCPGALDELVGCLSKESHPDLQRLAACALGNLAATDLATSKIANCPNALGQLTALFSKDDYREPQLYAARAFCILTRAKDTETILEIINCPGALDQLVRCLSKESHPDLQNGAACALGNLAATNLATSKIANCPKALEQLTRAKGALADPDNIIKLRHEAKAFDLQERGILKLIMGDWQGALTDLDEGLDVGGDDYELLKHRGYLAFLMKDEETARVYAARALKIQPTYQSKTCLGTRPVEYLDYKL